MALPAFDPEADYGWLLEEMRRIEGEPLTLPGCTTFLIDAFALWTPLHGERSYHEMYGGELFIPTEPTDDGGGACLAGIRYQHCA